MPYAVFRGGLYAIGVLWLLTALLLAWSMAVSSASGAAVPVTLVLTMAVALAVVVMVGRAIARDRRLYRLEASHNPVDGTEVEQK